MEDSLLRIGRVVKTHGIKGEVRVDIREGEKTLSKGKTISLKNKQGAQKVLIIGSSKTHPEGTILSFQGVSRIEEAENLVGSSIYVPKESLEILPPGEFYWYQLQGLKVETENGTFLGTLENILPTGSNDVFMVRKNDVEILIPATDEVVVQVDLQKKIMRIRPIQGLLPEDDF